MSKKASNLPVRATMCATCPFREGSKTACVRDVLIERIISEASHICHSTGTNNAFNRRTGKKEHLCRGARDFTLTLMAALKVIESPTDAAWNKRRVLQRFAPQIIKDP